MINHALAVGQQKQKLDLSHVLFLLLYPEAVIFQHPLIGHHHQEFLYILNNFQYLLPLLTKLSLYKLNVLVNCSKSYSLKDTHREKAPSNKTPALTKSMNMDN